MKDVTARGRFEQQAPGMLDRRDLGRLGPCLQVRNCVQPTGAEHLSLRRLDELSILGMEGDAQPGITRDPKGVAQSVIAWCSEVACGWTHEDLEPDYQPGLHELVQRSK